MLNSNSKNISRLNGLKIHIEGTFLNSISRLLVIPSSFILLPILTRNLSVGDFGTWSLIISFIGLILPFSGMGLSSALSRYGPSSGLLELKNAFSTLLLLKLILHVLFALGLYVFRHEIGDKLFNGQFTAVSYTGLILIISSLEPLFKRILKIRNRIALFSIYEIWSSYSIIIVAIYSTVGGDLYLFIRNFLFLKTFNLLILSLMIGEVFRFWVFDKTILKKYKSYGGYAALISIAFWLINYFDRFLISSFNSSEDVGIYSAIYSIGHIPRIISSLLSFLLLISLSKLFDTNKLTEVKLILSKTESIFMILVLPILAGSIFFSKETMLLLSTGRISEFSFPNLPLLTLAHIFLGLITIRSYPFLLEKKQKKLAITWILITTLNLILNLFLIPEFGILGSSFSKLISYLLGFFIISLISKRVLKFHTNYKLISKCIIFAFSINLLLWFLDSYYNLNFILIIVVVGVIYTTFFFSDVKQIIFLTNGVF